MKTFRTLALAAAAVVSLTTAALANTPPAKSGCLAAGAVKAFEAKSYISVSRPDRLNVVVVKNEEMPVKLRLLDADGRSVYQTTIRDNSALLPLNISGLERGTYTVELTRCDQTVTETVAIK